MHELKHDAGKVL